MTNRLKSSKRALVALAAVLIHTSSQSGGPEPVSCTLPPEPAAVRLFENIEDPTLEIGSLQAYEVIFSRRLLASSTIRAVDSAIQTSRNTYQDNRSEAPLSRRLAAPPILVSKDDKSFNIRGDVTVRILSLSTRGKIEQRISISCEGSNWKVQSFSYGPQEMPLGSSRP